MRFNAVFIGLIGLLAISIGVQASRPGDPWHFGVKVAKWSEFKTDEKTELRYRIGVGQNEITDDPMQNVSIVIEITNTGEEKQLLNADDRSSLRSTLWVDDKQVGLSTPLTGVAPPVVRPCLPPMIALEAGESWVEHVSFANPSSKVEAGEHKVSMGFSYSGDRGMPVGLKTAAVTVEFTKAEEVKED